MKYKMFEDIILGNRCIVVVLSILLFWGCEPKSKPEKSKRNIVNAFPKSAVGIWTLNEGDNITTFSFCKKGKFFGIIKNNRTGRVTNYKIKFERYTVLNNQPDKEHLGILVLGVTEKESKVSFELTLDVSSRGRLSHEEDKGSNYLKRKKCSP